LVPKSLRSPIFPPPIGANKPGNEKRYLLLFLWDFLIISLPWCLATMEEGLRWIELLVLVSESTLFENAKDLSLLRSMVSGFVASASSSLRVFFFVFGRAIFGFNVVSFVIWRGNENELFNNKSGFRFWEMTLVECQMNSARQKKEEKKFVPSKWLKCTFGLLCLPS